VPLGHTFRPELRGDFWISHAISDHGGNVWGVRTLGELLPGVNENWLKLTLQESQFRIIYMIPGRAGLIGSSPPASTTLPTSTTSAPATAGTAAHSGISCGNHYGSDAHSRRDRCWLGRRGK
jgi:hypothetical protein